MSEPVPIKDCICGNHIVVQSSPGEVLVKSRLVRANVLLNSVTAKCSRCKRWVKVPLSLDTKVATA